MSSEGRERPKYFPVFCTSPELPPGIIQKLSESKDPDGKESNCFVLALSRDQNTFEHGLKSLDKPVPSNFAGASIEALGQFCSDKFVGKAQDDQTTLIADRMFVVVDDRTLQGEEEKDYATVRVVQWDGDYPRDEEDMPTSDEIIERWETVRCRVDELVSILMMFKHKSLIAGKLEQDMPLSDDDVFEMWPDEEVEM